MSNEYIEAIIFLLAGLGMLLIGFKMLSDNIEKIATNRIKKLFNNHSSKGIIGVGIGALATALIQSSSATTVMVVGFVNAGILNLFQATAMIMGANIGTTITAQIVALGSFDFSTYAMLLAIIGIVMSMIAKKDKIKTLGLALSGLGLVFIALWLMQDAMAIFRQSEAITSFLIKCNNPILLLLFGIAFTALIQSSSAVTTILISMVSANMYIGNTPNGILFVILGSNIGTTITALLSSFGASTNAKRASFIHFLFNFSGAFIFFIILLIWKDFMSVTFAKWFTAKSTQIAMFHTFFNVICTLLFLPLINVFVKVSCLCVKDNKKVVKLSFIDNHFSHTPSVALTQASQEVIRFGELTMETLDLSIEGFLNKSLANEKKIHDNLLTIDTLNQELVSYLIKVASLDLSDDNVTLVSKLHDVINDLYREAEIADNMVKYTKSSIDNDLTFSNTVCNQISTLHEMINKQFNNVKHLIENEDFSIINQIDEIENNIDDLRTIMVKQHIERLEKNECNPASSGVFINLVSNLERAGDHLNYIAHSFAKENN